MKKTFLICSLIPVCALAAVNKPILVTSKKPIFTIKLKSNPTTGYRWFLASYDSKLLKKVSFKFVANPNKKMMGASGTAEFTFAVKKSAFRMPTQTAVSLVYARAWTVGASAKDTYVVRIAR